MSTLREAAQQALGALGNALDAQSNPMRKDFPTIHDFGQMRRAHTALRKALAQQEQEPVLPPELEAHFRHLDAVLEQQPVGEVVCIDDNCENGPEAIVQLHNPVELGQLLYTRPPRREWQSLTEEEIKHFAWNGFLMGEGLWNEDTEEDLLAFTRAVEQALKEKNQ